MYDSVFAVGYLNSEYCPWWLGLKVCVDGIRDTEVVASSEYDELKFHLKKLSLRLKNLIKLPDRRRENFSNDLFSQISRPPV